MLAPGVEVVTRCRFMGLKALQNAVIKILDKDAVDPGRGLTELLRVQFNPAEYNRTKAAQLADYLYAPTDYILINRLLGWREVAIYTPAMQIDAGLLLLVSEQQLCHCRRPLQTALARVQLHIHAASRCCRHPRPLPLAAAVVVVDAVAAAACGAGSACLQQRRRQ